MTVAALVALMSATLGAYIALLAWRFRLAPGLRDQGWFAAVAATGAAFTALNVSTTSATASAAAVVWANKVQVCLGALHAAAWLRYAATFLGRPRGWDRWATGVALVVGALILVPGVGYTGRVTHRPVPLFDAIYRDAEPDAAGAAALIVVLLLFLAITARFARAWWRGVPFAGIHFTAMGVLFAMVVNDILLAAGVFHGLYLLDLGFLAPVAAVTYVLSSRVVDESRGLAELRRHLEQEIAARTVELTESQAALLRAEKLASLGQFSAGVSHEVANPAAVLSANLRYLEDALQGGASPPADALECLAESREAVDQIALVTRQLLDASRFAAAPVAAGARVPVAEAVARARAGSGRLLEGHRIEVEIAPDLAAVAQLDLLARVLEQLLDNAARAVRPGRPGAIAVRAAASLGRARIVVEDDGVGMSEETLRRAFDPYFSTRPFGTGRGLGLAVARGLVHSMRGDLRLESAPGRGTRAIVEVPLAEPLPGPGGPAGAVPAA